MHSCKKLTIHIKIIDLRSCGVHKLQEQQLVKCMHMYHLVGYNARFDILKVNNVNRYNHINYKMYEICLMCPTDEVR